MVIYTDLDTLIDTRLGFLSEFYGNLNFLKDTDYKQRTCNEFFGLPVKLFEELYKGRTGDVITKTPYPTLSIDFINEQCFIRTMEMADVNKKLDMTVEINTYPYSFTKEVLTTLGMSIKLNLMTNVKIRFINSPELSVKDAETKYTHIFIHNGLKWLTDKTDNGELTETPIPYVTLFAPLLYDSPGEYDEDTMLQLMHSVGENINLELISVVIVSAQI